MKDIIAKINESKEGISKDKVRKLALENNLNVFNKKDSYDVCFITSTFKEYMHNNSYNKLTLQK